MNYTFQVIGFLRSCLVSLILTPFILTKQLTQIFVDCSRFNPTLPGRFWYLHSLGGRGAESAPLDIFFVL